MYIFCCFLIWLVSSTVMYRFLHKNTCSKRKENEGECSGAAIGIVLVVFTAIFWFAVI